MKTKSLTLIFALVFTFNLKAQIYDYPVAGKKSHPELEITQIEITSMHTVVSLKVNNKRDGGGWFCADKNIFLKNSNGIETYQLIRSENIPTCPDQFEFSYNGQVLEFKLYFPVISSQIKFLDLIENCNNACFSFYGIILDNEHNENIKTFEKAFEYYQNKQLLESISYFEQVIKGKTSIDSQIYGLSYYYLIQINNELKNTDKANYWLDALKKANISDKNTYLKELNKTDLQ